MIIINKNPHFILHAKNLLKKEKLLFNILGNFKNSTHKQTQTPIQLLNKRLSFLFISADIKHLVKSGRVVYSIKGQRPRSKYFWSWKMIFTAIETIKKKFILKLNDELKHLSSSLQLKRKKINLLNEARLNYKFQAKFKFKNRNLIRLRKRQKRYNFRKYTRYKRLKFNLKKPRYLQHFRQIKLTPQKFKNLIFKPKIQRLPTKLFLYYYTCLTKLTSLDYLYHSPKFKMKLTSYYKKQLKIIGVLPSPLYKFTNKISYLPKAKNHPQRLLFTPLLRQRDIYKKYKKTAKNSRCLGRTRFSTQLPIFRTNIPKLLKKLGNRHTNFKNLEKNEF